MSSARFRRELKQLPLMLGKVLAAMVSVAGFTMAVLKMTRRADAPLDGILAWLLLGGAGLLAFQLFSRGPVRVCTRLAAHSASAMKSPLRTSPKGALRCLRIR